MASWIKGKVDGAKKVVTDKVDDAKEAIAIKQAELEEKERVRKRLKWEKEREEAERIAEYEASKPRLPRDVAAAAEKGDVARVRRWFDEGATIARGRTTPTASRCSCSRRSAASSRSWSSPSPRAPTRTSATTRARRRCTTPLYQRTAASLLIDRGAVDQASYTLGMTATMYAAQYGDAETLRLLIDKGASWWALDDISQDAEAHAQLNAWEGNRCRRDDREPAACASGPARPAGGRLRRHLGKAPGVAGARAGAAEAQDREVGEDGGLTLPGDGRRGRAGAVTGTASLVAPRQMWFPHFFPVEPTTELVAAVRCIGGLLLMMFPILFVNRWNTINGKARAGVWIAATTFASVGMSLHGQPKNGFTVVAAAFVVEGLHLAFNANPMLTSAMLLEKEKAKAAKSK
ncbi:hypothetical protein JL721_10577 [Aureococcus anophagefferens]|nr:hypothetical protein JL721_10577 [Aureococcus anophagefferens]